MTVQGSHNAQLFFILNALFRHLLTGSMAQWLTVATYTEHTLWAGKPFEMFNFVEIIGNYAGNSKIRCVRCNR